MTLLDDRSIINLDFNDNTGTKTVATRQRILEAGAQLIYRQGYNCTGIQEILQTSGVSKGSFLLLFQEQKYFGLALIDFFGQFLQ
ncbi:hypothetical protein DFAR_3010003 [Desulfarculales bacterium]